jgi:hypothetical protein
MTELLTGLAALLIWVLGYAAGYARAYVRYRRKHVHKFRIVPNSQIGEGTFVALNEADEAVIVTMANSGELEAGVVTEVFKEPRH